MGLNWQPLSILHERFLSNLEALRPRELALADALAAIEPADEYKVVLEEHHVQLARVVSGQLEPLPNPVPPLSARDIARKLYPSGRCTEPALAAGLDHGWLWQALYQMECSSPALPGHRPPLYFLAREPERLWAVLHLHDWAGMLGDGRVRLFAGADAVEQCRRSMELHVDVPWAKLCVTIDPSLWPGGVTVDSLWQSAHHAANARMQQLSRQIEAIYAGTEAKTLVRKLRGERLRVLGITSRFTTFLKHSMSDWLDAFDALGHETHLAIERADHEVANPVVIAEQVVQFRPDLILMIDHYRSEIAGLPRQIPCAMWVQDHLPSIFSPKAGASQGLRDYCLGFGWLHLRDHCGYPEQRFMPAQVGVNDQRFTPRVLSELERSEHECDLSFVSHASAPATAMLTEQLSSADSAGRKLLIDVFEQMRGVYDRGESISHASLIGRMIDAAAERLRVELDAPSRQGLFDFFNHRVNNALFRHQALTWAAELGVNLHLYGRGWEQHPRFARYSRGVACNASQLAAIYQASRINLQITPFGAVHQRMLDGLAAGGFFLARYNAGDAVEPIYRRIYEWCAAQGIDDDQSLQAASDPQIQQLLSEIKSLLGIGPFELGGRFMDVLRLSADSQFIRSAASIWPEYTQISFASRQQLQERVQHFLQNPQQREECARRMRRPVIERFTYTATSARLLEFIADDMSRTMLRREVAA